MGPESDVGGDDRLEVGNKRVDTVDLVEQGSDPHPVKLGNGRCGWSNSSNDRFEPAGPGCSEEIRLLLADKIAVKHGVNGVLALGPAPDKRCAVGDELPQSLGILVRQPDL